MTLTVAPPTDRPTIEPNDQIIWRSDLDYQLHEGTVNGSDDAGYSVIERVAGGGTRSVRVLRGCAGLGVLRKGQAADALAREGRYKTILADPPWRFKNWSMEEQAKRGEQWARRNGRSPYDTLDTKTLCELPVRQATAPDCTLLLWCTWPKLADGIRVLEAWGFEYKSGLIWVKMTAAGAPRMGLGYHVRSASEPLLIGTRGKPPAPRVERRPIGAIFCPIGEHSAKPAFQYDVAEGYPGPYLELFHRPKDGMFPPRDGWRFLGDAVDGQDMRDALRALAAEPAPTGLDAPQVQRRGHCGGGTAVEDREARTPLIDGVLAAAGEPA